MGNGTSIDLTSVCLNGKASFVSSDEQISTIRHLISTYRIFKDVKIDYNDDICTIFETLTGLMMNYFEILCRIWCDGEELDLINDQVGKIIYYTDRDGHELSIFLLEQDLQLDANAIIYDMYTYEVTYFQRSVAKFVVQMLKHERVCDHVKLYARNVFEKLVIEKHNEHALFQSISQIYVPGVEFCLSKEIRTLAGRWSESTIKRAIVIAHNKIYDPTISMNEYLTAIDIASMIDQYEKGDHSPLIQPRTLRKRDLRR